MLKHNLTSIKLNFIECISKYMCKSPGKIELLGMK